MLAQIQERIDKKGLEDLLVQLDITAICMIATLRTVIMVKIIHILQDQLD
jgi:hypothetical protein